MPQPSSRVLQFKIALKHTKPPIWRRILVPKEYSFWDLHVAIQDAMGWFDSHLHEFEIHNPRKGTIDRIGLPGDGFWDDAEVRCGWDVGIAGLFSSTNPKATYTYDFGDNWEHSILLEKTLPRDPKRQYPCCTGGRRRCPPEDCGGPWGYLRFLEAVADPEHPEHQEMIEWFGGKFDPADFDAQGVVFDDPKKRLEFVMEVG